MQSSQSRWWAPGPILVAIASLSAGIAGYLIGASPTAVAANKVPEPGAVVGHAAAHRAPDVSLQQSPLVLGATTVRPEPHPLQLLTNAQIDTLVREAPDRLGVASIGRPNRGRLLNGVRLSSSQGIHVIDGAASYGTEETVRSIEAAVAEVLRAFPDSPPLYVGDLSRKGGGYLRPHRSHQSGRDVDLGYYYLKDERWYTRATEENLDRPRTWALLKALIARGNVEYVFMDRGVQRMLREYAESQGEPLELTTTLFESPRMRDTLVRHAPRHLTHLHVRFHDPSAEEAGRRLASRIQRLRRVL